MKKFILSLLCLVMLATPVALKADTNTQSNTSGSNTNITVGTLQLIITHILVVKQIPLQPHLQPQILV